MICLFMSRVLNKRHFSKEFFGKKRRLSNKFNVSCEEREQGIAEKKRDIMIK